VIPRACVDIYEENFSCSCWETNPRNFLTIFKNTKRKPVITTMIMMMIIIIIKILIIKEGES